MVKFFDVNCRIGRSRVQPRGTIESADDLLKEMDFFGIERALVYHAMAREFEPVEGNEALMREIRGHDRLVPCWTLPAPDARGPFDVREYIARAVDAGVRAVRIFNAPTEHNFPLTRWSAGTILEPLAERRMPLILEAEGINWDHVHNVCNEFPTLPVIVARPKYSEARHIFSLFDRVENLYIEISWFHVHRGIEEVVERFGAGRLLFGTGMPLFSPSVAIGMVMYAGVSDDEKTQIAGQNLQELLDGVR